MKREYNGVYKQCTSNSQIREYILFVKFVYVLIHTQTHQLTYFTLESIFVSHIKCTQSFSERKKFNLFLKLTSIIFKYFFIK